MRVHEPLELNSQPAGGGRGGVGFVVERKENAEEFGFPFCR